MLRDHPEDPLEHNTQMVAGGSKVRQGNEFGCISQVNLSRGFEHFPKLNSKMVVDILQGKKFRRCVSKARKGTDPRLRYLFGKPSRFARIPKPTQAVLHVHQKGRLDT